MPPVTLTKQQFLKKRPKGSYEKYLSYVKKARSRGGTTTTTTQSAARLPYDPTAPLTQQQIESLATQRATASLAPERAAITAERRAAAQLQTEQQDRITGFSKAAAELLAGQTAGLSDQYTKSAEAIGNLAAGFTGDLRARGEAVPGAPAAAAANAAYAIGGYIPGTAAGENALRFTRQAAEAPATQLGIGQTGLRHAIHAAGIEDKKFAQALIDLGAKVPELRAQLISDLQSNELNKVATRINAKYLGLKAQDQGFSQTMSLRQQRLEEQKLKLEQQKLMAANKEAVAEAELQGQELDNDWSEQNGFASNVWGEPILKNGKKIPWKEPKSGGGPRGGTWAERHPFKAAIKEAKELRGSPKMLSADERSLLKAEKKLYGKYVARPGAKGKDVFHFEGLPAYTNNPAKAEWSSEYTWDEAVDYLVTQYNLTRSKAIKALTTAKYPRS